jgi:hypothetical protein
MTTKHCGECSAAFTEETASTMAPTPGCAHCAMRREFWDAVAERYRVAVADSLRRVPGWVRGEVHRMVDAAGVEHVAGVTVVVPRIETDDA